MILDLHTHHYRPEAPEVQVLNLRLQPGFDASCLPVPAENLLLSAGIHPWDAGLFPVTSGLAERFLSLCSSGRIAYVGELGLDKVRKYCLDQQWAVLRMQLSVAERLKKPVIIHCVRAMQEIISLKPEYPFIPEWIVHGFRGNAVQARQWLSKGFHLSFGLHFDREAFEVCPPECRYRETDDFRPGERSGESFFSSFC